MLNPRILLVTGLLAMVVPHVAFAGEIVHFSLREDELATPAKRELLLDRIEKVSVQSCKRGSVLATRASRSRCADDLTNQFVQAIDNDALTLLVEAQTGAVYRTAHRQDEV